MHARVERSARLAAGCVLVALVATACTAGDGPAGSPATEPGQTGGPAATASPTQPSTTSTPSPSTSATPTPTATEAARVLPDRWYVDDDGDLVSNFIEAKLGYDPAVDDCAPGFDCPGADAGQLAEELSTPDNTLLILDSSGSMAGPAGGGQTKLQAAKAALKPYAVGTPPELVKLGFMVYGHKGSNEPSGKAESCAGVEVLAPLGELSPDRFARALDRFSPTGYTPIGAALERAAQVFAGKTQADNRVVLVTDGEETCGGNPVAAARALRTSGVSVRVDVVGYDIDPAIVVQLRAIAEAGGGTYTDAQTGADLENYLQTDLAGLFDLFGKVRCLIEAQTTSRLCTGNRATAVQFELLDLAEAAEEAGRSDEAAAIRDLNQRITARTVALTEERERMFQQVFQPALEAFQRAQERLGSRYGRTVPIAFHCPYGGAAT